MQLPLRKLSSKAEMKWGEGELAKRHFVNISSARTKYPSFILQNVSYKDESNMSCVKSMKPALCPVPQQPLWKINLHSVWPHFSPIIFPGSKFLIMSQLQARQAGGNSKQTGASLKLVGPDTVQTEVHGLTHHHRDCCSDFRFILCEFVTLVRASKPSQNGYYFQHSGLFLLYLSPKFLLVSSRRYYAVTNVQLCHLQSLWWLYFTVCCCCCCVFICLVFVLFCFLLCLKRRLIY